MSAALFGEIRGLRDQDRNPLFLLARDTKAHAPARALMHLVFDEYHDKDGHFVRDFQTEHFSARVWELSLFAYLQEARLAVADVREATPDFLLTNGLGIEAVTSQPTVPNSLPAEDPRTSFGNLVINDSTAMEEFQRQIRKSITNKMRKRTKPARLAYWELPHMKGKPFVLAVHAFYKDRAHAFTDAVVGEFLMKPGGLFEQPEMENLSAVLFSNSGTLGQFNRIGYERGHATDGIHLFRVGVYYDRTPGATRPAEFEYKLVPGQVTEDFGQSLHLFHNPNAIHRVPQGVLPGVRYTVRNFYGDLVTRAMREFVPFASHTLTIAGHEPAVGTHGAEPVPNAAEAVKPPKDPSGAPGS